MTKRKLKTKTYTYQKRVNPKAVLPGIAVSLLLIAASVWWFAAHTNRAASLTPSDSNSAKAHHNATAANGKSAPASKQQQKTANTTTQNSTANPSGTVSAATPPAVTSAPKPPPPPPPVPSNNVHSSIITTYFWVGEAAGPDNANISNSASAWDENWQTHFGGVDDPAHRNGYFPAGFTPSENPFYVALPYNDKTAQDVRKSTASSCANAGAFGRALYSWCKNTWVKVTHGDKTTYAQWEDVGPLEENDYSYVFGVAAPKNTWGGHAGLDVSPAVHDYLGLQDTDRTTWSFVSAASVPAGPWKQVITTTIGDD